MTTAVKVDEDAKSRLKELQAEIRLRTGTNAHSKNSSLVSSTTHTSRGRR
jgi:hypothetical protein